MSAEEYVSRAKEAMASRFTKFAVTPEQLSAWEVGFAWLHSIATAVTNIAPDWLILPEYAAPLVSGRPDAVILSPSHLFIVEMKTGAKGANSSGKKQVQEYARTFWGKVRVARRRRVHSILLSSKGKNSGHLSETPPHLLLEEVLELAPEGLQDLIFQVAAEEQVSMPSRSEIISDLIYSPRPSVVEAATALVASSEDKNVVTGLSSGDEIEKVLEAIRRLAAQSRINREHTLVVVAGPPGAGKTLVGLRLAHDRTVKSMIGEQYGSPLYLTGNGPLVEVLIESLARDEVRRKGVLKPVALASASSKVRLIHGITKASLGIDANIIIFDEGQRVWTAERMRSKRGDKELGSEAEEILKYMEAHDWALVVVLLGEGQEINSGEEGLSTWVEAVKSRYNESGLKWTFISPEPLGQVLGPFRAQANSELRLQVVRRTDNAADVSSWASLILESDFYGASKLRSFFPDFPIYLTRDLAAAKNWLYEQSVANGGRKGLLASSRSKRLFLYGVDVVADPNRKFSAANWYLNDLPDLSSSEALEVAATEYKSQGLELDWVGLCWSWDMILQHRAWVTRELDQKSSTWKITRESKRSYQINAYRVLLTRARKGLIIWVPPGDSEDISMLAEELDQVAVSLLYAGVKEL